MGEWSFIGQFFDKLQGQSTLLGRVWLFIMLVFRIVILGTVASGLFSDEQSKFVCNTLQPGCNQVCYDQAFPISQYRFWVFHIVIIATPPIIFLTYATHQRNKKKTSETSEKELDPGLRRCYMTSVIFRTLLEIGFMVGQCYLFGFRIEPYVSCEGFPCPKIVECFISRPTEKTIFNCFYFAVGVISAFTGCVEFIYNSIKWSRQSKSANLPPNDSTTTKERKASSSCGKQSLGRSSTSSRRKNNKQRKNSVGTISV